MDDDYYDGNSDDKPVCKVYDVNDHFTSFVQFFLAFLAICSLWIKRMNEIPRRRFSTWFLDVSKQAVGAAYGHVLNMMVAAVIASNVRGEEQLEDQCAWYAINFLIDTTLGLFLAVMGLRLLDYVAATLEWKTLQNSGVYTGDDGLLHWFHQLVAWLSILTFVKVILLFVLWIFSEPLAAVAKIIFKPLQANIRFELIFVMILFPAVMNILYFWITDTFLKAKPEHKDAHESPSQHDDDAHSVSSTLMDGAIGGLGGSSSALGRVIPSGLGEQSPSAKKEALIDPITAFRETVINDSPNPYATTKTPLSNAAPEGEPKQQGTFV